MYRFIEKDLENWSKEKIPHPILLRGPRQIGKTYIINKFGQSKFCNFININFDFQPELKKIFHTNDVQEIVGKLELIFKQKVETGKTLIFLDEIQECPEAFSTLRYFYEKLPGLHLIAAGSLLEFYVDTGEFSFPVGRVHNYFMQPMSFYEFLHAAKEEKLLTILESLSLDNKLDDFYHEYLLGQVKKYFLYGGMPELLAKIFEEKQTNPEQISLIQNSLIVNYREDFRKYASKAKQKYLERVFSFVPFSVSKKFKYSNIDKEIPSRDLKDALELLVKAGVVHQVYKTSVEGLPLAANISERHFKTFFMDIGLMQKILGTTLELMNINLAEDSFHSIAAGALTEQFVGQELLANKPFHEEKKIFYWLREEKNSSAEVDYLISVDSYLIPIEVKAGKTGRLRSLHFLIKNKGLKLGVQISQKKLSYDPTNQILSVPFYAVAKIPALVRWLLKSQ